MFWVARESIEFQPGTSRETERGVSGIWVFGANMCKTWAISTI